MNVNGPAFRYSIVPELIDQQKVVLHEHHNLHNIMDEKMREFQQTIVETRDKAIREALIALGWTPPQEMP